MHSEGVAVQILLREEAPVRICDLCSGRGSERGNEMSLIYTLDWAVFQISKKEAEDVGC